MTDNSSFPLDAEDSKVPSLEAQQHVQVANESFIRRRCLANPTDFTSHSPSSLVRFAITQVQLMPKPFSPTQPRLCYSPSTQLAFTSGLLPLVLYLQPKHCDHRVPSATCRPIQRRCRTPESVQLGASCQQNVMLVAGSSGPFLS